MIVFIVDVMLPGDRIKNRYLVQIPADVPPVIMAEYAQQVLATTLCGYPELFDPKAGQTLASEPLEWDGKVVQVW